MKQLEPLGIKLMILREMYGSDLTPEFRQTVSGLGEPVKQSDMATIFRANLHNSRSYIAEVNGVVVGMCRLVLDRKYSHEGKYAGTIEDVVVRDDVRKQGIGQALVEFAIAKAKELKCYKVILNCIPGLVPFYQRCGFHTRAVGMRIDL